MKKVSKVMTCPRRPPEEPREPLGLIFLWLAIHRFAVVHLHVPGVACLGIAGYPDFNSILGRFTWHILLKPTLTSERDQALVHGHISTWIIHRLQALHPFIPDSRMAASLSLAHRAGLVLRSSNRMMIEMRWNVFSGMVAQKIALPI